MTLSPGARLGPYEILSPLGAGGMGEVYRAADTRLDREVALKLLPEAFAADPDRLARFEREAKTVAALNHPNIVTLFSIEEAQGVRFLTMELVEGQNLGHVVVPGGLPLARVLDLAIALADALVAAHDRGVVHRDLKPANVMVTREGRVKVLDFGLAKPALGGAGLEATQAATLATPISGVGQVVGTVPYMAPEQVRGEKVDARTDLFALGILLYELLTGRRPFRGGTSVDVGSAILRDTPVPVLSLRSDIPPDLDRILARCLEKDPERRVQTAKDVRNELERVRRATESSTSPASIPRVRHPQDIPSIAVLPFVNRSRDEEDEYFADGLADELLNVLVKIRGLRVAARTSSFQFKGKNEDLTVIGQKLNVATLLEGSVRKAGQRVRIAVQLVKVADGYHLWSETYDRTLEDIFAVQDDIAQSVVKELRTTLLGSSPDSDASGKAQAEVAAAAKGRSENAEAHRLYLQGRYFVERFNQGDTKKGIQYLQEALALDPSLASAWVQIAYAHTLEGGYGWAPVEEAYGNALEAAERALALSPDLAEAHVMVSRIRRFFDWDWKAAETSSRRALELAPGSAVTLGEAGSLAHHLGRYQEAMDLLRRACEQDPLSSRIVSQLGMLYRSMDRLPEAVEAFRKALELSPQRLAAHHVLAMMLSDQGKDAEALAEAALEPARWAQLTALAYLHHAAGRDQASDEALAELTAEHATASAYQIAILHAARGDADGAFAWMDRGFESRDAGLAQIMSEPTFRPLHGDPRWSLFLRKMGFIT